MNDYLKRCSRRMSKILRHDPEGLEMDSKGWIKSNDLINHFNISMNDLIEIVDTNDKKRFVFNTDKSLIRAAQGHSNGIATDKEYPCITMSQSEFNLYHGTDKLTAEKILNSSINTGSRNHVHWTKNIMLATKRAEQRKNQTKSEAVFIVLDGKKYMSDGNKIYVSENEVYLTDEVPAKYLRIEYIKY